MSEENLNNEINSEEGVVLANTSLPSIGFLVSFAIYDGSVKMDDFVQSLRDDWSEGGGTEFNQQFRSLIPNARTGGSAFSLAVKSLQSKRKKIVLDNPDDPLTNNPEKMRVRQNGEYGYTLQWSVIPLTKNREYALRKTREGYVDGQPKKQIYESTVYRIRLSSNNANSFARKWSKDYRAYIWNGESEPNTNDLRNLVIVEPMKASSLPEDGRFMRLAQERLRNAFVQACTCLDDDKLRKKVRTVLKESYGGILPHASSGANYFIHDPRKERLAYLERMQIVINKFSAMANSANTNAMWVAGEAWWDDAEETDEFPIPSHSRSAMRILTYGSSKAQLDDIKVMYIENMQGAQAKYYELVQQMLQNGEIDEDILNEKRKEVVKALAKATVDLDTDTVKQATATYQEVKTQLSGRLANVWTPDERTSEAEKTRINARISRLLSFEMEPVAE